MNTITASACLCVHVRNSLLVFSPLFFPLCVCVCVCECVCWRETTRTPLSPRLLLSASESGTRRKRPIIKNPSLHLCSVGINHFFAFLFSFFPLLWLSDIPRPFPPSPKPPTPPRYSCSRTHAGSLLWPMPTSTNFASDSSQSLKIAAMLPGPSSAPYLIIFEREAGWGWFLDCLLLW